MATRFENNYEVRKKNTKVRNNGKQKNVKVCFEGTSTVFIIETLKEADLGFFSGKTTIA